MLLPSSKRSLSCHTFFMSFWSHCNIVKLVIFLYGSFTSYRHKYVTWLFQTFRCRVNCKFDRSFDYSFCYVVFTFVLTKSLSVFSILEIFKVKKTPLLLGAIHLRLFICLRLSRIIIYACFSVWFYVVFFFFLSFLRFVIFSRELQPLAAVLF